MGSKLPKLDMNMSLLLLGLVILVLGNIYYTFRQFNELNGRINSLSKQYQSCPISNNDNSNSNDINNDNNDETNTEQMKNIFINEQDNQLSENITKDIEVLDNDNIIEDVIDEEEDLDINYKEMENELNQVNIEDNSDRVNIFNNKSKKELMEIAEDNSLSKTGTKTELINRLVESGISINE